MIRSPYSSAEPGAARDPFCTTRWTVVLEARGDSTEGRIALSALCEAYYEPVLVLLARALREPATARDVAHDFFVYLLEGDRLTCVGREGGKFRAYLSGAVKHFVAHRRESEGRLRRGGGVEPIPLHAGGAEPELPIEDGQSLSPDLAFDRAWGTTVLARALAALRAESDAEGRLAEFEQLKPWLTGDAAHGAQINLARNLNLDPNALKATVHRLKQRFRLCVKNEIASTLSPAADVEEEMRALFAALAS